MSIDVDTKQQTGLEPLRLRLRADTGGEFSPEDLAGYLFAVDVAVSGLWWAAAVASGSPGSRRSRSGLPRSPNVRPLRLRVTGMQLSNPLTMSMAVANLAVASDLATVATLLLAVAELRKDRMRAGVPDRSSLPEQVVGAYPREVALLTPEGAPKDWPPPRRLELWRNHLDRALRLADAQPDVVRLAESVSNEPSILQSIEVLAASDTRLEVLRGEEVLWTPPG